jgi:tRNA threonylcarbamoyladenosine biosynthesis protein TsaB
VKLLGLDTATSTAGIAIVDGDRVLGEARHDARGRGADLLVKIDELCRAAGVAPRELDAIAIGAGPGSFTGLRIGMATAKGIAFAANRPLWAVSSLAALAADAFEELAGGPRDDRGAITGDAAGHVTDQVTAHRADQVTDQVADHRADPLICAVLDARRGEVFAGWFRGATALGPERVMPPAELAAWLTAIAPSAALPGQPAPIVRFAGDAIEVYREVLGPLAAAHGWLAARTPSGRAVARLALAGARADITVGGAPSYIRPSEAEVKYPDGVPGALRRH